MVDQFIAIGLRHAGFHRIDEPRIVVDDHSHCLFDDRFPIATLARGDSRQLGVQVRREMNIHRNSVSLPRHWTYLITNASLAPITVSPQNGVTPLSK